MASVQKKPESLNQSEFESLASDFLQVAETQLAKMDPKERKTAIASIHATAESLRAER